MAKVEITNKLLKEAIADAEAVRQTAIENAKLSLEETFTPQIKSMLSRRLRAEAEGMEHDEEEKDVEKKEAPEAEKEAPKAAAPKTETAKELPFQDGEAEGSSEMPADSSAIGTGDNKEPSPEAFDSADDDMSGEDAGESDTDWYDDWTDADFDLDEVIKELEADLKEVSHDEDEKEEEKMDEAMHDEEEKEEVKEEMHGEEDKEEKKADEVFPMEDPEGGAEKPEIPAKSSDIGTEAAHNAADVNTFVTEPSDVNKMEGEEMKGHEEEVEEELDLEAILAELEAEDEKHKASSEKVASLEKELAEYRQAVKLLRGKLHEVNLLNAKLLFTNKIFRKEGLTTEQKVMVVENFDRATTVREIKMVYTVLVETLTSAAKVVKATKASSKVVAEGFASKATPSTAPKTEAPAVIAENSVAKRLQQLAGIIS